MPFAIEQANALSLAFFVGFAGILFLVLTSGETRLTPTVIGLGLGFGAVGTVVAFLPIKVFGGWWTKGERYPRVADLDLEQRRVLVALYEPSNRRAAFLMVLATSALFFIAWRVGLLMGSRRLGGFSNHPLQPNELMIGCAVFSGIAAVWAGLFGLTRRIRAGWPEIVSDGRPWPGAPEYPGPLKESIRSFFTRRLPDFLTKPAGPGGNSHR